MLTVGLPSLVPGAVRQSGKGFQHGMSGLSRGEHRDVAYTDSVSARPLSLCLCRPPLFSHCAFLCRVPEQDNSSAFCPTCSSCMMLAWDCTGWNLPPPPGPCPLAPSPWPLVPGPWPSPQRPSLLTRLTPSEPLCILSSWQRENTVLSLVEKTSKNI